MTEEEKKYMEIFRDTQIQMKNLLVDGATDCIKLGGSPSMFMIESIGGLMGIVIMNMIIENPTADAESVKEEVSNGIYGAYQDILAKLEESHISKEKRQKMN